MVDIKDIDLSTLSQDELKSLAAQAIGLIENPEQGIGTKLFEALITIVPQPSVEALVVDNLENPQKAYLIWREDQHYHGWHFTGTFIRLGETFDDAIRRVLRREINTGVHRFRATNVQYSRMDSRGHTIGMAWLIQPEGEPTGGEWFSVSDLPDPTLPHHIDLAQRVFGKNRRDFS